MKKTVIGIGLGTLAGLFDLLPMLIQKLPFNACLSAFTMWIVIGFFMTVVEIKVHSIIKAILIAILVLIPNVFIIGWDVPEKLIPIGISTVILSGIIGYLYGRYSKTL